MTDILDEAIYDYKEEQKLKRLKRFLILAFILTMLGAISLFVYDYYSNKSKKLIQENTKILLNISSSNLSDEQYKQEIDLLSTQENKNIKELALLDLVSKYIQEKDLDNAINKLDLIINGKYSKNGKQFAIISKFGIILDKATKNILDKKDQEFVDNFLKSFHDSSEIFFGKALLYKSLWYINQGDTGKAKEYLNKIKTSKNISQADLINADCVLSNIEIKN